jgi:hypothetical protein
MDGFDKIAGSDFEQRVQRAGRAAVKYRDVRNNPTRSANQYKAGNAPAFSVMCH